MTRAMCSAILTFEAIVVLMCIPLLVTIAGLPVGRAVLVGGGLCVACLVVIGVLGRPWGTMAGHLVQVAMISVGFITASMFVVGIVFAALWVAAIVVGVKIDRDRAIR